MKKSSQVFVGALILLGVFAGGVLGISEYKMYDVIQPSPFMVDVPTDSTAIERGRHIAQVRGCMGCHGDQLAGRVFTEEWDWVKRAIAPNIAKRAKELSVAELEAVIRHGIGQDGRAMWSMPSYNWVYLSDQDMVDLIAFLKSAPVVENEPFPKPKLGFSVRLNIALGKETHLAQWALDMEEVPMQKPMDSGLAHGEYIAMTTCNECHGYDLRGPTEGGTGFGPNLAAMIQGYSEEAFRTLMSTGEAIGGRTDIGLMTVVAKDRFAHFTEEELTNLYAFLRSLEVNP